MRLADFILANVEAILQEWEDFARSLAPGTEMEVLALRDDAEAILRACVRDMRTTQSGLQQTSKSKGHGGAGGTESDSLDDASSVHGVGRVGSGFNLNEVVSEYRALRASVLRLWQQSEPNCDHDDVSDITRFNEAIDQSLAKAVASYAHRVDQSRRMFLAILGHDLRNPLSCISMSAQLASFTKGDRSRVVRSALANHNERASNFPAGSRPARLRGDRAGRNHAARHGPGEFRPTWPRGAW
jgi:hypothetical protein